MWNTLKHWVDVMFATMTAGVLGAFAWVDLELPHITAWLSFISMLLSVIWWAYRYYSLYKGQNNVEEF